MRPFLTYAAIVIVIGLLVPRYVMRMHDTRPAPAPVTAARPASPAQPASSSAHSVVVPRDRNGQFRVEGSIDGRRVGFMVDTGASVIALTAEDAAALGIHPAAREYRVTVSTANGMVRAAPAELGMVEIGDVMVRDVSALVMPDGALNENLLGLSFLSRLRHFEYRDGRLVLEQ